MFAFQLVPKRQHPWPCEALFLSVRLARFEILESLLLGAVHLVVRSFVVIPLLCKGFTEPQGIPDFLQCFPARLLPLPLLFVQGARRQLGVETFLGLVDEDIICKTNVPLEALLHAAL